MSALNPYRRQTSCDDEPCALLLGLSCDLKKLSRRGAHDPPKMETKMALMRETTAKRDFAQTYSAICTQKVLCSFDAARDYILMRRHPGGCLELPREMIRAEMDDGRHLVQRRTAGEVFHDVLNDGAELLVWEYTARGRRLSLSRLHYVPIQPVTRCRRGERLSSIENIIVLSNHRVGPC
jgi:hypothetical protein